MTRLSGGVYAVCLHRLAPVAEYGRDMDLTFSEIGLAGHWMKSLLHYTFIYQAKLKQVRPSQGTPTLSPILKRVTLLPVATKLPTISWPGINGSFGAESSPSRMCRSVRHTPQACTLSRMSSALQVGCGSSASRRAAPGFSRTIARMMSSRSFVQLMRRRVCVVT